MKKVYNEFTNPALNEAHKNMDQAKDLAIGLFKLWLWSIPVIVALGFLFSFLIWSTWPLLFIAWLLSEHKLRRRINIFANTPTFPDDDESV